MTKGRVNYSKNNIEFLRTTLSAGLKYAGLTRNVVPLLDSGNLTLVVDSLQDICPSAFYIQDKYQCNGDCKNHWDSIVYGHTKVTGIDLATAISSSIMRALSLAPEIKCNAEEIRINIYNIGTPEQSVKMDYEPKSNNKSMIIL